MRRGMFNPGFEEVHSGATSLLREESATSTPLPAATNPCPTTTIDTVANPPFVFHNNITLACSTLDQTDDKVDRVEDFFEESPKTIVHKLQQSAAKWNLAYRGSGTTGPCSKSRQIPQKHFVQLTQFDSHDSGQEENKWKQHLEMIPDRSRPNGQPPAAASSAMPSVFAPSQPLYDSLSKVLSISPYDTRVL